MNDRAVQAGRRSTLIFAETQRFDQPWLRWMLRGLLFLFVAQTFVVLAFLEPDPPQISVGAYRGLLAASIVALALVLAIELLFRTARLETVVRKESIVVRFVPFHAKDRSYPVHRIRTARVVAYAPIREYGGWGIRRGFGGRGRAYNVRGDRGLRLVLDDGQRVLIGTQRPVELAEAIRKLELPNL